MPEWNEDVQSFMRYWFAGFVDGLESIDEPARKTVLRACGKACARSYTAEVFREAWKNSAGMEEFLRQLSVRFPDASYEQVEPGRFRVRYTHCACDLVQLGLVSHPLLCDCSAQNLESNFSAALGTPVRVTLESSLLRGTDACQFVVEVG